MDHLEEIDARIAAERERLEGIEQVAEETSDLAAALTALLGPDPNPEPAVRRAVLMRADIPLDAVRAAATTDPDPGVRGFAVGLGQVPAAVVETAISDPAWQVRAEVARRSDCSPSALANLALDRDPVVRRAALAHPAVPVEVLVHALLSATSRLDAEVAAGNAGILFGSHREALLGANRFGALAMLAQPRMPAEFAARFARSDHTADVRARAVAHLHCPPKALASAAMDDPDAAVRAAAAQRTECPQKALRAAAADVDEQVRRACASNASCPTDVVDRLLADDDDVIRRIAAGHGAASPPCLAWTVAHDESMVVRKAAVSNPRCPTHAVADACSDPELVFQAVVNPACDADGYLAALVTIKPMPWESPKGTPKDDPGEKGRARVRDVATRARKGLRRRPWSWLASRPLEQLRADDLEVLLRGKLADARQDSRDDIRIAVARHPDADAETLVELASDPCAEVRAAASARVLAAALGQSR